MPEENYIRKSREKFLNAYKEKDFKTSFYGESLLREHKRTEKINSYEYCVDLYNVAFFYQKSGNLIKSCNLYKENIEFFSNLKKFKENTYSSEDAEIFVDILTSYGVCLAKKYEFRTSLKNFEKAYKIAEEHLKNSEKYLDCLYNLGAVNFNLKNYDKAINFYLKLLEKKEKKDLNYADTLNSLGYCYEFKKDFEKAVYYLDKSLSIIKGLQGLSSKEYIANLHYISGVYESAKDYNNALKHLKTTMKLIETKYGDKSPHISEVLSKMSNIYLESGDVEKSVNMTLKSLKLIRNTYGEKHLFYTNNLRKLADIYYNNKDYKNALEYYKKESQIKKEIAGKENGLYIETLLKIIKVCLILEDFKEVSNICDEVISLDKLDIKKDLYEKALLLIAKELPKDDLENLSKIKKALEKFYPNITIEEMTNKANKILEGLIREFYIPKDSESKEKLKEIELDIFNDLKNFIEKNLNPFNSRKSKNLNVENKEDTKIKDEDIKNNNVDDLKSITIFTDKLDEISNTLNNISKAFDEDEYIQENILDLFYPDSKNEDEPEDFI